MYQPTAITTAYTPHRWGQGHRYIVCYCRKIRIVLETIAVARAIFYTEAHLNRDPFALLALPPGKGREDARGRRGAAAENSTVHDSACAA